MMYLPSVPISSNTAGLPSLMLLLHQGVMVYIITTTASVVVQSLALRSPSVRKALDIPRIPDHMRTKPPTFADTVRAGIEWYKNKSAEAQAQTRAQQRKKF